MSQSNLTLPTRTEAEARAERAKHTPGPWEETNGRYLTITAHGREIARMAAGTEVLDNARLIAAAPDLLEALRLLLKDFRTEGCSKPNCSVCKASNAAESAALRAIAKAEGGQ